jgi:cystathionine beta-lyase/cystathionine gamma-synthase
VRTWLRGARRAASAGLCRDQHTPFSRGASCPTHGHSKPARSTPARRRTAPPAPGHCRSTRRRRSSSPAPESAADRFALAEIAPIYTRIGNPTQDAVEQRIASLEGGLAALLLSSGQAAETYAILNVAEAGDHIVASPSLYGGTYNLLGHTLKKFGVSVTFVADPDNLEQWRDAVQPNTKLFFAEVVSNPRQDVLDIEGVARTAHEAGVP